MNIKMKRFATVLGISAGLLATGIANAGIDFDNTKFYVGAEAGYTSFGKSKMIKGIEEERRIKLKKNAPSATILAGVRLDNFGIEVGATKYKALKIKEDARFKVKPNNFYMDLVGYMPIESNMELIGSIGLGKLKADLYQKGKNISKNIKGFKSSKVGPRVGFGGQYNFNENLSTRVMVRYQKIGNKSIFKSATTASIGIVYTI